MARHPHFARILTLLAVPNDDPRILPDWKPAEDGLDASEHVIGVCAKKEEASFFIPLQDAVVTIGPCSRSDSADHSIEIEVRYTSSGRLIPSR